jgi:hypothetical protein
VYRLLGFLGIFILVGLIKDLFKVESNPGRGDEQVRKLRWSRRAERFPGRCEHDSLHGRAQWKAVIERRLADLPCEWGLEIGHGSCDHADRWFRWWVLR